MTIFNERIVGKPETLFIDLIRAGPEWNVELAGLEIRWEIWEAQPMADQIKLSGCTNVPTELPAWLRRSK